MNILIAPNDNYIMPTIVLLQSLFDVAEEQLDIYMFYSNLAIENIKKLEKFIVNHGGNFLPIIVNTQNLCGAHISGHITGEAYYRLLAQDLLPVELDRILYLDADIIVRHSIQEFYYLSFENANGNNCFYIVCEGPGISRKLWDVYDNLKIPYNYPYFNSGVLLINLSLLRESYNTETTLKYIKSKGDTLNNHDQDTLNALFYDKVKYVDWHIYNQTILHIADEQEAKMRLDNARIIHYAGPDKPWNPTYSSWYFNEFWQCACRAGYMTLYIKVMLRRFLYKVKSLTNKLFG